MKNTKSQVLPGIVLCMLGVVMLIYAPLVLSIAEHILTGTNSVVEFSKHAGVYDVLDWIYESTLWFL